MLLAITYNRKSTDDKKHQVASLKSQRRVAMELSARTGLRSLKRYDESQTAKLPGRPKFNRMCDEIEAGKANAIICWSLNRLFRNPVDECRIRWMLQRGVLQLIRTPTRDYGPNDAGLIMAIEGGRAADESASLAKNIRRGIEEKLLAGEWPAPRSPGYIYDYNLGNIIPHPRFGKLVTLVFKEVSEGGHGLRWTSERLFALGFTTQKGKKWPISKVRWFLSNEIYRGIMKYAGVAYEGRYKILVEPEVFASVQRVLRRRSKPHRVREFQDFAFRGIFSCTCGAMVTAQIAKGNGGTYRYYRCTRSRGPCAEPYVQEHGIVSRCLQLLEPIGLRPNEAKVAREILDTLFHEHQDKHEGVTEKIDALIAEAQIALNNLTRSLSRVSVDDESYTTTYNELVGLKASLKAKKARVEAKSSALWFEPVRDALEALESAAIQQATPSIPEIASLVRKVGTNHLFSRKTVSFELGEPYAYTAQLLAQMRDHSGDAAESGGYTGYSRSILLLLVNHLLTHFQGLPEL